MDDKIVVQLTNVYLRSDRGNQLFKDLNFRLTSGRTAVITGGPGSGKSSLIRLMLGLTKADEGSVEVLGQLIRPRNRRTVLKVRRQIGGIGGLFSLIPSFTVAQNITYPLILQVQKKRFVKDNLFKMLTEFSLLNQANEYPHKLTRVENTIVQFARALVAHQPLLIFDEPSAGFDHATFARLWEQLVKVSLSGRSMIILTSEPLEKQLPNTDSYRLENGVLL